MYEVAVACVDADVGDAALIRVLEEDQIAGFQLGFVDGLTVVVLIGCCAGKVDAACSKDIPYEARAVESRS